jgi:hypothetical protein
MGNEHISPEDFAKLQALAESANQKAEEAKTAAEARQDVKQEVIDKGEKEGLKVDEQTAELLANAVVSQLEARGAFGAPAAEPEPDPSAAPPATGAPAVPEPGPRPAVPPDPTVVEEPPKKKSLAERFQGR